MTFRSISALSRFNIGQLESATLAANGSTPVQLGCQELEQVCLCDQKGAYHGNSICAFPSHYAKDNDCFSFDFSAGKPNYCADPGKDIPTSKHTERCR